MKKLTYILLFFLTLNLQGQELMRLNDSLVRSGTNLIRLVNISEIDTCLNSWLGGSSDSILINSADSATYIKIVEGAVVNGQLDSSVLLDMENAGDTAFWNKNNYYGNAGGHAENWDYPFYYEDVSNPYHWKVYELHYRRLEEQLLTDSNRCFARFNYFNGGEKMERFFFFSNTQVSDTLKIRKYCWILPTYLSEDKYEPYDLIVGSAIVSDNVITFPGGGGTSYVRKLNFWEAPALYSICVTASNVTINTVNILLPYDGFSPSLSITANGTYTYDYITESGRDDNWLFGRDNIATITVDYIKRKYVNYYRKEAE